jgi:hypothetical protein
MDFKDNSIQMVKPYFEQLAKTYKGYMREKSPILFGRKYDASTDEYDLVLEAEDNFELGIRSSKHENKTYFILNAYFILLDNGKRYKVHKHISSDVLNEDNIKTMVQKFIEIYDEERKKS